MSISSDDSLGDLPLPYDISSAVSRALRINSTDGTGAPDDAHTRRRPSNSLTAVDKTMNDIKPNAPRHYHNPAAGYVYERNLHSSFPPPGLHQYTSTPPVYDHFRMEAMEAWNDSTVTVSICSSSESMLDSQNDMDQLDQFCNYIVSNSDDDMPLETTTAPIYPTDMYPTPTYHYRYAESAESPPRKKARSASSYADYHYPSCSSTESSPEKCTSKNYWRMKLENAALWRQFDEIGTEMVITKGGRYVYRLIIHTH